MPKNSNRILSTDREVHNAKPHGTRAEFRIKGAPGLILRVSANGAKSWTFLFASPSNHKRCKIALGAYPTLSLSKAKDKAQRLAIGVRDGNDPLAQRRSARTMSHALEVWEQNLLAILQGKNPNANIASICKVSV